MSELLLDGSSLGLLCVVEAGLLFILLKCLYAQHPDLRFFPLVLAIVLLHIAYVLMTPLFGSVHMLCSLFPTAVLVVFLLKWLSPLCIRRAALIGLPYIGLCLLAAYSLGMILDRAVPERHTLANEAQANMQQIVGTSEKSFPLKTQKKKHLQTKTKPPVAQEHSDPLITFSETWGTKLASVVFIEETIVRPQVRNPDAPEQQFVSVATGGKVGWEDDYMAQNVIPDNAASVVLQLDLSSPESDSRLSDKDLAKWLQAADEMNVEAFMQFKDGRAATLVNGTLVATGQHLVVEYKNTAFTFQLHSVSNQQTFWTPILDRSTQFVGMQAERDD
jgi:hypothetical protein